MTIAEAIQNAVLSVALTAAHTAGAPFTTMAGAVRKFPKLRTNDPEPFLIVSPLEESEKPDGATRREVSRTLVVAVFRLNDGKLQDLTPGNEVRTPIVRALENLSLIVAAAVTLLPTVRVTNNRIEQRYPWEMGAADVTFDVNPVCVTVTTQEDG